MRQFLKRLLISLICCAPIYIAPIRANGDTSPTASKPDFRTEAQRAEDVVNVKDFGAQGDGATDDSGSLNAAMNYVRLHRSIGSGEPGISQQAYSAKLIIPHGRFLVKSTLNWTNLVSLTIEIDCQGCVLDGQTSGAPVIDAIGSRWLHVNGLTIWGNRVNSPSIGLQIGRTSAYSADDHHFNNVTVAGYFTFAALYDFAAETTTFDHLMVWNQLGSNSAYGVVLDGINHWHASSAFAAVTAQTDRPQSFNEALFINPSIMVTNGAPAAIWIAGASRARFITGYVANTRGPCGTVLYSAADLPITQLAMDVHYETNALKDVFCIDGPMGTKQASIRGLTYTDNYPEAANSVFIVSDHVASVTMRDTDIHIDNFYARDAKVFDNPTLWTVTGRYSEISGNHWNLPSSRFQGFTDLAGQVTMSAVKIDMVGGIDKAAGKRFSPSANCGTGQIMADANYLYVCVSQNKWKRAPLESASP